MLKEIELRRSVRKFKDKPICPEDLRSVLDAGRLAPSGCNFQPWKFLVITDKNLQARVTTAAHEQTWMLTAPVMIIILGDLNVIPGEKPKLPLVEDESNPVLKRVIRDASIAATNMMLESVHLGLGTCWAGWYQQSEMRETLNIPNNFYICGILVLGYPDEDPAAKPRKSLEEIVQYNSWK